MLDEEPEPEVDISALMDRQRLGDTKEGTIGVSAPELDDDVRLFESCTFLTDTTRT